jgi:hypothetical protein
LQRLTQSSDPTFAWLIERHDAVTASKLIPITDDLTHLAAEINIKRK